ncbi:uncharacterized protein [Lolium perenne]|jgi:hypothetical protein|uniref:uncharacterized protein isoform X2 n=1 Tax=Lolium perenne TaxID=4522 RepID=UPI0021EB3CDF
MALIRALPVLLLLLSTAGASAAPPPAPAPATGLEVDELCFGISTSNKSLACAANVALACLAANAATEEVTYMPCFATGILTEHCLTRAPPEEKGCIGVDISEELITCLGKVGLWCQGSSFGDVGFVTCYLGSAIKCLLYK